jgi:hypothetical protein
MKNMMRPQVNAMMIQESSTLAIGSFHQIRCGGGVIAMVGSPSQSAIGIWVISMMPQMM